MSQKPNKKLIGFFFTIGLLTFIFIVGYSVLVKLWNKNSYMAVMYFDESMQGLNVGAPVVFKGVQMGKVTKIALEANPQNFQFKIPVYVEMTPIKTDADTKWQTLLRNHRRDILRRLIDKGLRAKLRTQSFITGQLMIELDIEENAPLNLVHSFDEQASMDVPEIPTLLSTSGKFSKGLEEIQFQNTFDKVDAILNTLNKQLPILLEAITKTSQNLEKISKIVSTDTIDRTNRTLTEVSEAMRSLRNLTDYLEQYPESLLKGKQ